MPGCRAAGISSPSGRVRRGCGASGEEEDEEEEEEEEACLSSEAYPEKKMAL